MTTFTSMKGVKLEIKPVSQFKLDTLRASKADVPVPVYQAKIAGGGMQEYPLDAVIAEHKNRMPEWNDYIKAKAKLDAEYSKTFLELIVWDGVDVVVPDLDSEWQKTSEHFGIKIPDNPIERKLFYVYNELLGTPEDIGNLIAEVFTASQIDEEAVTKLRTSFLVGAQRLRTSNFTKKQRELEGKPNVEQP